MDDTAADTSLVLGSASSKDTPRLSSRTRSGRTPAELQAFATALLASPRVTEKIASNPPAPGTPASRTPSIFIVASNSWVWDSGSIWIEGKEEWIGILTSILKIWWLKIHVGVISNHASEDDLLQKLQSHEGLTGTPAATPISRIWSLISRKASLVANNDLTINSCCWLAATSVHWWEEGKRT